MVINKPELCHSVEGKNKNSVENWLKENFPALSEIPEFGLVHRLDFETTGCILVAKNKENFDRYRILFRQGETIQKIYWALVSGHPKPQSFSLYFSSRYKSSKKMTVKTKGSPHELGKCRWKTLRSSASECLLEIELLGPGRRHQIRAGLSFLGHPLFGDRLYGGPPWPQEGIGLHSRKIILENQIIEAPTPESWNPYL